MKEFIDTYFQHFNSANLKNAAKGWLDLEERGGKMFISIAGAMSTAGIGQLLAQLIREDRIAGISCTGANLEEDVFRALFYDKYVPEPNYKRYSPEDDFEILQEKRARVTDVSIPDGVFTKAWEFVKPTLVDACAGGEKIPPSEIFYRALRREGKTFKDSWVYAAMEKGLTVFTPGFEDSTTANGIVTDYRKGFFDRLDMVKNGLEQFNDLIDFYQNASAIQDIGFLQIGGGIAGDFPLCVVPSMSQDLKLSVKPWQYFAQISDSTESYGGYSGASPMEKITWAKLGPDCPTYVIESDATIVAPLIFSYVLEK